MDCLAYASRFNKLPVEGNPRGLVRLRFGEVLHQQGKAHGIGGYLKDGRPWGSHTWLYSLIDQAAVVAYAVGIRGFEVQRVGVTVLVLELEGGLVRVNCAQESPNTPGRIFGYGEGDLAGPVQYTPTSAAEAVDEETPSTTTTTPLPDTGGPSLLLPASLLLASGLIGLGVMRRKST